MEDTGVKETEVASEIAEALQEASRVPYNNATVAYHAAGITPDRRFGGSCLDKLSRLQEKLPAGRMEIISAHNHSVPHYAILFTSEGETQYLDPLLWQKDPLPIYKDSQNSSSTICDNLTVRQLPNEEGELLTIALVSNSGGVEKTRAIHKFTESLGEKLPKPSETLKIRPELPSYQMQLVSPDGICSYRVWYTKDIGLNDLWKVNNQTGEQTKFPREGKNSENRPGLMREIEASLNAKEEEIIEFFETAYKLEQTLSDK